MCEHVATTAEMTDVLSHPFRQSLHIFLVPSIPDKNYITFATIIQLYLYITFNFQNKLLGENSEGICNFSLGRKLFNKKISFMNYVPVFYRHIGFDF